MSSKYLPGRVPPPARLQDGKKKRFFGHTTRQLQVFFQEQLAKFVGSTKSKLFSTFKPLWFVQWFGVRRRTGGETIVSSRSPKDTGEFVPGVKPSVSSLKKSSRFHRKSGTCRLSVKSFSLAVFAVLGEVRAPFARFPVARRKRLHPESPGRGKTRKRHKGRGGSPRECLPPSAHLSAPSFVRPSRTLLGQDPGRSLGSVGRARLSRTEPRAARVA